MSRAHRTIVTSSAALWLVSTGLMFTQLMHLPDGLADFWRVAAINAGALAACLTTVAVLPYMLRDFYQANVTDYVASFLAGWAAAQEDEPDEPATVTPLRSIG